MRRRSRLRRPSPGRCHRGRGRTGRSAGRPRIVAPRSGGLALSHGPRPSPRRRRRSGASRRRRWRSRGPLRRGPRSGCGAVARELPETDRRIPARGRQRPAVGRERGTPESVLAGGDRVQGRRSAIPEVDDPVAPDRGQRPIVGGECDRLRIAVAELECRRGLPAFDFPDEHHAVLAGRGQALPVVREGDAVDLGVIPLEPDRRPASGQVADDGPVAGEGQQLPVGGDRGSGSSRSRRLRAIRTSGTLPCPTRPPCRCVQEIRRRPSGVKIAATTLSSRTSRLDSIRPVAASQSFTVRSSLAVASFRPSGEKLIQLISSV